MPHNLEIIDGKLYAYGDNSLGQLGLGHQRVVMEKSLVLTNTPKDSIPWINSATGRFHSVGLKEDGSLWVWGDNRYGQLGLGIGTKLSNKPIELPTINFEDKTKKIEIVTGYYFTVLYQYFEKGYGFGEFENFDTGFVNQYRQIVEMKPENAENQWISINAGPKTLIGFHTQNGYKYSDWSGEFVSSLYVSFANLKVGDLFTLYDPSNRNRVLYKKVRKFSKGQGCCPTNAICLHRMYRELISLATNEVFISENYLSVYDMLDPLAREKFEKSILTAKEKYGTDFTFKSALTRHKDLSRYKGLDPWTLNALFTMTGTKNTLDLMLYDSLFFSDDLTEPFNQQTLVEKISAKETFEPYSDISLPPYILEKTGYTMRLSQYILGAESNPTETYFDMPDRKIYSVPFQVLSPPMYWTYELPYFYKKNSVTNLPLRFTFTSRYGFGYPIFKNKDGKLTNFDTDEIYYDPAKLSGIPGCPYNGSPKYIRELEQDDSIYSYELATHTVDLPIDETGKIISVKHILDDPYLIKMSMAVDNSVFKQASMDPTKRITTKYDGKIDNAVTDPGNDPMMFYTPIPDPTYTGIAASPPTILVFYIGSVIRALVDILLSKQTPAREVQDYFGLSKQTLGVMWDLVNKATYPYKNDEKTAFAKLSALFYNKLKDQPLLDSSGADILATGATTNARHQLFDYNTLLKACYYPPSGRGSGCSYLETKGWLPYLGVSCWTDRIDKSKLILFGNHIDSFKTGKTIIKYQTWSKDSSTTRNGTPVVLVDTLGKVYVAKDAYTDHSVSVQVLNASFDQSEFTTIVQLKTPFLNNYLMGNLNWFAPASIQNQAMPFIYFNSVISIFEKLKNIQAPLKS